MNKLKWFQLAQILAPILSIVIPGAGAVVPYIMMGITDAQHLHGDTNNAAKKQLVYDGVNAAVATGKVKIDPVAATAITDAVFSSIDHVHDIVKSNTQLPAVPPAAVVPQV